MPTSQYLEVHDMVRRQALSVFGRMKSGSGYNSEPCRIVRLNFVGRVSQFIVLLIRRL